MIITDHYATVTRYLWSMPSGIKSSTWDLRHTQLSQWLFLTWKCGSHWWVSTSIDSDLTAHDHFITLSIIIGLHFILCSASVYQFFLSVCVCVCVCVCVHAQMVIRLICSRCLLIRKSAVFLLSRYLSRFPAPFEVIRLYTIHTKQGEKWLLNIIHDLQA